MSRDTEFLTLFQPLDVAEGKQVRRLKLMAPFRVYSRTLSDILTVPEGFEFDGESIPVALHWLVPPFGQSKRGACVHDFLYRHHGFTGSDGAWRAVDRKTADQVYFELVQAKGLPRWRALMRYSVLRLVGWKAWAALLVLLLPSCAQDIAGFSRDERLTLYGAAATLAGKPEMAAIVYGLRRPVTSAKQPKEVRP